MLSSKNKKNMCIFKEIKSNNNYQVIKSVSNIC